MARSRCLTCIAAQPTIGMITPIARRRGKGKLLAGASIPDRSRRTVTGRVRLSCISGTSWDIFLDADLALECGWNASEPLSPTRSPHAPVGDTHRRRIARLHRILFAPSLESSQLRRHDQRFPLDVLAHAAVAGGNAAHRGSVFQMALDPGVGPVAADNFRSFR